MAGSTGTRRRASGTPSPSGSPEAGYLEAAKKPGRTRERTHYRLTDQGVEALAKWVRSPAPLPRIQNEPVVRLLAGDLVDPSAVAEGLGSLREEVSDALEHVARAKEISKGLPGRAHLLEVNHRYAERLLELQREWLDEAERALARAAPSP